MPERVFLGLGSNLGDSVARLRRAAVQIGSLPQTHCVQGSGFYQSPAWGGVEQPDYTNAVLEIATQLQPLELLHQLLAIERDNGRDRQIEQRWGPRTLDCDILLFGERQLQSAELTVPHPRMAERAFVLVPLSEIAPEFLLPGLGALSSLIANVQGQGLQRLEQGFDHVYQ